jgi:putative ABC transport system permease protein
MNTFFQDLRYGFRVFIKNPTFTAVAVLALALGIGATTAIFSVVNSVLLRPLPYGDPDRLVQLREYHIPKHPDGFAVAPASFMDWQKMQTAFEAVGAYRTVPYNLVGAGEPERVRGARVSAGFITMLGINPAMGRDILPEEDAPGKDKVVIISHGLWQRLFGGAADVLGQPLTLSGNAYTIIGVMPQGFDFPSVLIDVWTPMAFEDQLREAYGAHFVSVIARLKPNVTFEQANTDVERMAAAISEAHPDSNAGWRAKAIPMLDYAVGDMKPALIFLLAAVACVLLIACANVANLLLARAATRQKEIAIRTALGASRSRLIRQLLTESVLLSIIGGGVGLVIAAWGIDALMALAPENLPRIKDVAIDSRALLFTAGVTILTGLVFGLAPALQASKPDLNETLKEGGRGTSEGRRRQRMRNVLVVAEVALAIVPLIGGGLLVRSLIKLQQVNPGFDPDNALTARIQLSDKKYPTDEERMIFYNRLTERLAALPGVEAVGGTNVMPITDNFVLGFIIEGRPRVADANLPITDYYAVTPDYFRAIGIPLISGRHFTPQDDKDAKRVCVINATFAKTYFPDEDPIGRRVHVTNGQETFREIVGIVGDVKQQGLDKVTKAQFYEPFAQQPSTILNVVVRSSQDASMLGAAIRREVLEIDGEQPVGSIAPLDRIVATSIARQRFHTLLLTIFSVVAMALAGVGLYGIVSYSVAQRTHEIGIRMALGASSRDVLKMVVGNGMLLALAGVGLGLTAAFIITRLLSSWLSGMLFEVGATDLVTFTAIPAALTLVALAASYIPARRAMKVDPMVALRYE